MSNQKSKSLNHKSNSKNNVARNSREVFSKRSQSLSTKTANSKKGQEKTINKQFNCFDKFIQYLISFNKLEKEAKNRLKKENPRTNISDKMFRINIPLPIIEKICLKAYQLFSNEPNLLQLSSSIYIFGDIHGQYCDLLRFFDLIGLPPKVKFLFLGDYVDRGDNSLEVISLLFSLKIKFPKQVFLLRGNHECNQVNDMYGFKEECEERYGEQGFHVWTEINKALRMLPICALIDNKIFATHGGISPHIENLNQINKLNRNVEIPDSGILCDLVWSDPKSHSKKWCDNDRGVSYTFNERAVDDFMKKIGVDLIVRAHQVVDDGFEFFNGQKMVTVFSAPNYCGQVGNQASVMKIKKNLECSFITLKPVYKKKKNIHSFSISKK